MRIATPILGEDSALARDLPSVYCKEVDIRRGVSGGPSDSGGILCTAAKNVLRRAASETAQAWLSI